MFSKTKIITYLFLLAFTVITVAPVGFLYAETPTPVQLAPLTGLNPPSGIATEGLAGYLQTLFWLAIVLAGVLAVLMITKGGVLYMTSEAFNTKADAKNQITMAIIGFLLAISSVLILTTINPDLLKFNLLVRTLKFEVPKVVGTIGGCTNLATAPVTKCEWKSTSCPSSDYIKLTDSYCSGKKPAGATDVIAVHVAVSGLQVCCGYIPPSSGCSGSGVYAGFINCQWSPDNTCAEPSFKTTNTYCEGKDPSGLLSPRACCTTPI